MYSLISLGNHLIFFVLVGETKRGLLVGLGGGGLAMFLYKYFKQVIL